MNPIRSIVVLLLAGVVSGAAAVQLRAGAAAADITPQVFPVNMPGGFSANYATNAHDLLHARALVFDDGANKIAMVVADTLSASPEALDEAKALAAAKTGIATNHMLVASTHTHSGVRTSYKTGPKPEVAYRIRFVNGIAQAIIDAHAARQPAPVAAAGTRFAEEVFNRRWHLKPGKMPLNPFGEMDAVKMNPGRSPAVLDRAAGPKDVMIINVQNHRRRWRSLPTTPCTNRAALLRGVCPADAGAHAGRQELRRHDVQRRFRRHQQHPVQSVVATKTADAAWFASKKINNYRRDPLVGMIEREIDLKYRKPTAAQLAEAKRVAAIKGKDEIAKLPRLAQNYARSTIRAFERPESLTIKLQAIRIGDIAVVGIPFETLVEIGLELKAESPFQQTMVIGLANGRHGYLPTPEQHKLGGYETWLGTCVVEENSSVIIVKHLLEMLGELKKR